MAVAGRARVGKSVLMNVLIGRIPVDATIRVCNLDVRKHRRGVRQLTSLVARCGVLEPQLTVRQNVGFVLRLAGSSVPTPTEMDRALRQSDVPDRLFDCRAQGLSPYESFCIWMAIARMRRSELLLLDEPASLLSPSEATRVAVLIREVCAARVAALVTTRDQRFAADVGDSVYHLQDGRLSGAHVGRDSLTRGVPGAEPDHRGPHWG